MFKRVVLLLTTAIILVSCQARSPESPSVSTTPRTSVSPAPAETQVSELVRSLRQESEVPEARMDPEKARLLALPQPFSDESVYLDGSRLTPELVSHLNSLRDKEEEDWSDSLVEEANQDISPSADFTVAVSRPVRLSDGRWYSAVEWYQGSGDGRMVKEVGVADYGDGGVSDVEYKTVLRSSSVRPSGER